MSNRSLPKMSRVPHRTNSDVACVLTVMLRMVELGRSRELAERFAVGGWDWGATLLRRYMLTVCLGWVLRAVEI